MNGRSQYPRGVPISTSLARWGIAHRARVALPRNAVLNERPAVVHFIAVVTNPVGTLERLHRACESGGLIGEHREQRLALDDPVARLHVQVDARRVLHRVLLARTPRTEPPRRDPE